MSIDINKLLNDDKELTKIARKAFDSVDEDKSGQIDFNELKHLFEKLSKDLGIALPSEEDLKAFMILVDSNNSGKIDFHEFKEIMKESLLTMMQDDDNDY